jgi:predicted NUDIX family NTP pyrophosphohydrolase
MPSERVSAGVLMYRRRGQELEVFLAHPGGPFFKNKDEGHWTIPKGEVDENEELLSTAIREFREEIGIDLDPRGKLIDLGSIRQKGGKVVHAWAIEGDCPAGHCLKSNNFKMEWPPKSGKFESFPEVDRAEFFEVAAAKIKIKATQIPFLDRLEAALAEA